MANDDNTISYFKGRGSQVKPHNKFRQHEYVQEHTEALDEELFSDPKTQIYFEHPKKIINKVDSPDLHLEASMNPYQGCEHGCIYCYARNTHAYWGFNAGLDFESKIIVKENAAELLAAELSKPNYEVKVIMLSGNTDCYQPLERKFGIARKMLEVLLKFKHPVGIITKNALITRDLDLLKEMAEKNLVVVTLSITSLNEKLRRLMEPRTASCMKRLETVYKLSANGIPVNVNVAPIIPSINSDEVPAIIKAAADAGASDVHYTMVRLNGDVGIIFEDWVKKNFPDRADKVLNHIKSAHGGSLNDSNWGRRMSGDGNIAESIGKLFRISKAKYFAGRSISELNSDLFSVPGRANQGSLF